MSLSPFRKGAAVEFVSSRETLRSLQGDAFLFSGYERNRLFLNQDFGAGFLDASDVSGTDSIADGRCFAILDFDRNGLPDLLLSNDNAPRVQLFRNVSAERGRVVAVRVRGAGHPASNRDGIGTHLDAEVGERTLTREFRCGEGLASQNSSTKLIGLGEHERAERIRLRWPSGKVTEVEDVEVGTLLTCYENPAESTSGSGFDRTPYYRQWAPPVRSPREPERFPIRPGADTALTAYVAVTTHCSACVAELPRLRALADDLTGQVTFEAVAVDPKETQATLDSYVAAHEPPYPIRTEASLREAVVGLVGGALTPATVVVDREGRVRLVTLGVPTLSQLRAFLADPSTTRR